MIINRKNQTLLLGAAIIIISIFLMLALYNLLIKPNQEKLALKNQSQIVFNADTVSPNLYEKYRKFENLAIELHREVNLNMFGNITKRNPFFKIRHKIDTLDYYLLDIKQIYLPVIYNGFVQKADGTTIAQINLDNNSYFVTPGDQFEKYRVLDIAANKVKVEKSGQIVILEYNKLYQTNNFVAILMNSTSQERAKVQKGDVVDKFYVVKVKRDQVLLKRDDKEYILKLKGD